MRSQVNWIWLIIAIFFILIAIPRDTGSYLGQVGIVLDDGFSFLLGGEMGKCPFLRRGMLISAFNEVSYPMLVNNIPQEVIVFQSTMIRVPSLTGATCELDNFINFNIDPTGKTNEQLWSEVLVGDISRLGQTATATCGNQIVTLSCNALTGPCECLNPATGELEYCVLGRFMVEELLAPDAQSERELFGLIGADIPPFVCFVIFGILPFLFIYYFMQDILVFTMFTPSTRKVIAMAVGLIGVYTGAFIGVTVGLVKFMKVVTGLGTLMILLGVGFAATFLVLMAENVRTFNTGRNTYYKMHYGIQTIKSIGAMAVADKKKPES